MQALHAFTLVEILFASAITAILVVIIASMANQAMKTNETIVGDAMRGTDAAFVLETVLADLEALTFSDKQEGEVLVYEPEIVNNVRAGRLMLLSATMDGDDYSGAPRAVSYRVAYQNPIDGSSTNPVHSLYRAVADAEITALHATGLDDLENEFWENPGFAPDPIDPRQFVISNIVDFDMRFRVRQLTANGLVAVDDDGQSLGWEWTKRNDRVRVSREGAVILADGEDTPLEGVTWEIDAAEVRVTVISPRGATLLAEGLSLDEVVNRHGRAHVRRTAAFAAGK